MLLPSVLSVEMESIIVINAGVSGVDSDNHTITIHTNRSGGFSDLLYWESQEYTNR